MRHFVITVPLRRGSADAARQILREGPPFNLEDTSLERHMVFVAGDELVFLFEGAHAEEKALRLLQRPGVLGQAGRLAAHVAGPPRIPAEVFAWAKDEPVDGIDFGSLPGPGDSEGGGSD
jgi:hypothetical protein